METTQTQQTASTPGAEPTYILPGFFSLVKNTFSFYGKNWKKLAFVGLIPFLLGVSVILLRMSFVNLAGRSALLLGIFALFLGSLNLINSFLNIVAQIAFIKTIKEFDEGTALSTDDAYVYGFKVLFPFLWVGILSGLLFCGSAFFLIIPAIAMAGYLLFSIFSLVIDDKRGLNAILTSFYYMRGNWWKVAFLRIFLPILLIYFGVIFVVLALGFLFISLHGGFGPTGATYFSELGQSLANGNIPLIFQVIVILFNLVIFCVLYPLVTHYYYSLYKHLKAMKPVPNLEVDMKKPRQFFTGFAIFGIVSGFLLFFGFVLLIGLQSQKYTNPNENPFLSSRSSLSQHTPVDSLSTTSLFPVTPSPLPVKHILMTATYSDTASGFTIQPPEGWVSSGGVTDGTIFTNKNLGDQAYISIRKKSDIPAAAFLLPTRNIMDSVAQSFNRLPNFNQAKYSLFSSGLNTLYSIEGSMNENHVQYYFLMTKQEIYLITVQSASKDWSSISQSIYDSVGTLTLTNK